MKEALAVVNFAARADANRDGVIDFADARDTNSSERPYRFWVNDAADNGDANNWDCTNAVQQRPNPNSNTSVVNGKSDLLNYFPIAVKLALPSNLSLQGITVKQSDSACGLVPTRLDLTIAGNYLRTNGGDGYGSNFDKAPDQADIIPVTAAGVALPQAVVQEFVGSPGYVVFLVEGRHVTNKPLVFEAVLSGGAKVVTSIPINISEVQDMFRWINLRGNIGASVARPTSTGMPINYPDVETNGSTVVFVHGFRMSEAEALGSSTTMFKRLYQYGSNARFVGVAWHGDHTVDLLVTTTDLDYYTDVHNAFMTAPHLASELSQRGLSGTKTTIMAHSLGNIVVSSAIAEHGLVVGNYALFNAAVTKEAYNPIDRNVVMYHPEWVPYFSAGQGRCSAAKWSSLFQGQDYRSRGYGWSGLFGNIPQTVNCLNYYSTGDEVLRNFDATRSAFPDNLLTIYNNGGHGRDGIWYAQEINKGRWVLATAVLAGHGGWGWSSRASILNPFEPPFGHATWHQITTDEVSQISDIDLAARPIFRDVRDTSIYPYDSTGESRAMVPETRATAMGESIPVLGQALGGNPIVGMTSADLNLSMKDGWPYRPKDGLMESDDWRHSDILYVAPTYLHKMVEDVITQAGLK